MKTVILCGGLGTRMNAEAEFRPKPMIMIGNRPILWHIMRIYARYGYNEHVLCLGYKGEVIRQYFYNYHMMSSDFRISTGRNASVQFLDTHDEPDLQITMVDTGQKTLKGGRLKRVQKYISEDTFMLTYGDGVADVHIRALVEFHGRHGRTATVTGVRPPSRFGELVTDGDRAMSFTEKPQTSKGLINGGFFVFNRRIFDYLTEAEDCDLEKGALESLAKEGELMVYEHRGQWACMDTPRDTDHLERLWNEGRAFWKVW